MSKKYKACIYLRISNSDDKALESESLSNQRSLIENFVSKNPDIEIILEKVDDGYTGLLFDRPAFKEMMEEVFSGNIDCIIVKDLSRLGRDYIQTGTHIRNTFPEYGIRFIAISDNIDTKEQSDLSEKLDVTLKTILNDAYSSDISKKTRSALKNKRENGQFVSPFTVYGYIKDENNKNKLVIDTYASEVIKDIFNMRKNGKSAFKIAHILNEKGILSPLEYKKSRCHSHPTNAFSSSTNSLWSAQSILRILKDETYVGDLIQGKKTTYSYKLKQVREKTKDEWDIVRDTHKPIISRENFDLVQKIMQIDTRTTDLNNNVHLFAGILICGCCGNRMVRKTVPYKDKKYYYYYCPTGRKNGCTTKMFKEDKISNCVIETIKAYINNILTFEQIQKDVTIHKSYNEEKFEIELQDIQAQIDKNKLFKSRLYESFLDNLINKSEHNLMKKSYDAELSRLNVAKAKILEEQAYAKNKDDVKFCEIFKEFENMSTLSRTAVIHLLHSITIGSKIDIKFRYQSEFEYAKQLVSEVI